MVLTGVFVLISDLPLVVYEDPCRTKNFNMVKLKLVRNFYGLNLDKSTLPDLKNLYLEWRDTVELIPMRLKFRTYGLLDVKNLPVGVDQWIYSFNERTHRIAVPFNDKPGCSLICYEDFVYKWINKKSCKRGNDVYIRLIRDRFNPLIESSENMDFFSTTVNDHRKRIRRTRMLYLTGTCDPIKTGSLVASWVSFGVYWNHFITSLKNVFGKTAHIRTWQSQKNGYPHYHALIYFFEFEFTVVKKWDEVKQKDVWRIHNRQHVVTNRKTGAKEPCIDVIVDRWKWGGLEVVCCENSRSALKDLLKYVLRDLEGGESDLTNTMVWYFGKKSFAVSRSFEKLFGVGAFEEPSNADLINAKGIVQEAIPKDELISIDIFPLIPREMFPEYRQLFIETWKDPPDPSPEMVNFLDNFALSCVPSSSGVNDRGVSFTVYKFREDF